MFRYIQICSDMSDMLWAVLLCLDMSIYVQVISNRFRYDWIVPICKELVRTYKNLYIPIQPLFNLSKPFWTYLNLFKHIWTYLNIFDPVQTYPNLAKLSQIYPNPSESIQTSPKLCKHIQTIPSKWESIKLRNLWIKKTVF